MQQPCSNCARNDAECIFTNQDLRRNKGFLNRGVKSKPFPGSQMRDFDELND